MIDLVCNLIVVGWLAIGLGLYLATIAWRHYHPKTRGDYPFPALTALLFIPFWPFLFMWAWLEERTDYDP